MEEKRSTAGGISNRQELEVRWGDCDAAGIVYYAKYFDLFTDGRVALLKKINIPYQSFFHNRNIVVVAVEATCRYRKSLFPEERYFLSTTLSRLSRTRMVFDYTITSAENELLVAEGRTVHAFVDSTGKPFDIKKRHPELWSQLQENYNKNI
ncbi:acyl-CoA thioesterase [Pelotomaculum propionicicum]|uniref:acyl-CoA thioesterase n=1 Tax=Pelotomaculum propionicicum TaxID=258475 RepID=UPI003B80EB5C